MGSSAMRRRVVFQGQALFEHTRCVLEREKKVCVCVSVHPKRFQSERQRISCVGCCSRVWLVRVAKQSHSLWVWEMSRNKKLNLFFFFSVCLFCLSLSLTSEALRESWDRVRIWRMMSYYFLLWRGDESKHYNTGDMIVCVLLKGLWKWNAEREYRSQFIPRANYSNRKLNERESVQ